MAICYSDTGVVGPRACAYEAGSVSVHSDIAFDEVSDDHQSGILFWQALDEVARTVVTGMKRRLRGFPAFAQPIAVVYVSIFYFIQMYLMFRIKYVLNTWCVYKREVDTVFMEYGLLTSLSALCTLATISLSGKITGSLMSINGTREKASL